MKKSLVVLLLIAFSVLAVFQLTTTDSVSEAYTLNAPANIQLINDGEHYYITWENIDNNNGYTIKINDGVADTEADIEKNVTQYNADSLIVGKEYEVFVKTIGIDDNISSDYPVAGAKIVKTGALSKPTNLAVSSSKVLSWDAVTSPDATSYKVVINGVLIQDDITGTSIDLSTTLVSPITYAIKIMAVGDNQKILDSKWATYNYVNTLALAVPQNVTANADTNELTWTAVDHAVSYGIVIDDGEEIVVNTASYDISALVTVKDYQIKVRALAHDNYTASSYSEAITFSREAVLTTPTITIDGDKTISFGVENATSYTITITKGGSELFKNTEYTLTSYTGFATLLADNGVGEYIIEVSANSNGNYQQSAIAHKVYGNRAKLATPDLSMSGTVVSWTAVTNAVDYTISIEDRLSDTNVSALSFDIAEYLAVSKTYTIKVKANSVGWYDASDVASITYDYSVKFATPILTVSGLTLSWDSVLGAESYVVSVGDNNYPTTECSMDMTNILTTDTDYTVYVKAIATGFTDSDSASITMHGQNTAITTRTYKFNNVPAFTYYLYVNGVRTEDQFIDNEVTLSNNATTLYIVVDAVCYADYSTNYIPLFGAIDLTSCAKGADNKYTINADCVYITDISGENSNDTVEELGMIQYNEENYYYLIKPSCYSVGNVGV